MNKANECTCPSGDGSLVHPCPAHPAVEQVGGDERAAFEAAFAAMGRPACRADYDQDAYGTPFDDGGWTGWQARAALAQPSPVRSSLLINGYQLRAALDFIAPDGTAEQLKSEACIEWRQQDADFLEAGLYAFCAEYPEEGGVLLDEEPTTAQPSPLQSDQAEAERPEGPTEDELEAAGLGYPLHKEEAVKLWYSGFRSEVITVLEAWEAIGHDIGMNPDKGELLDSLRYMLEKCEAHDAALARVAELERQQPVAWMHDQPNRVDVIHRDVKDLLQRVPGSSRGIYRPLDVSEHYTIPLYAAPVAQAQHSVPEISGIGRDAEHPRAVVLYLRNEPSEEDMRAIQNFLRAMPADVPAKTQHSVPDGTSDLCRFLAKLYCELDGLRYSTAKLPAEQIADALIFKWPVLQGARNQLNIKRISEQPYDESKLHSAIAAMLAAAPGKEVPQAWLDVQAERRRQITAEGWTPEHDDEHSHGQMARAAACYALAGSSAPSDGTAALLVSLAWPWDEQWWKPSTARRDMVKACALALAEIERLDRAAPGKEGA
ncbi:TPA: hypothetical protein ACXJNS_003493 [Pseudomonas aeruginosa]